MNSHSTHSLLIIFASMSGGVLAGAIVGVLETVYLCLSTGTISSLSALWFAVLAYSAAGLGIAFLWSLTRIFRKLPANISWLDSLSVVVSLLVVSISLFRVRRDLLNETVAWREPAGLLLMVGALICIFAGFFVLRMLLGRIARATTRNIIISSWSAVIILVVAGWLTKSLSPTGPGAVEWLSAHWRGGGTTPPNVLLIIVDTLRDDFLTDGSPHRVATPNIDSLSASGVRFLDCRSQASKTRPSVTSILTSLYPSTHGAERKIDGLSPDIPHFPQILGEAGYSTVGLVNNINLTPFFGFSRGFQVYRYLEPALYLGADDAASNLVIYGTARKIMEVLTAGTHQVRHYYWEGEAVAGLTADWLKSSPPEPFFLWVYLMDPHDPYFEHPYNGKATARVTTPNPSPDQLPTVLDRYDSEIQYMDRQVGRIMDALMKSGKTDSTIVIFTADHGEEFLEHGGWWHGTTLYHEVLDVPLIIKLPANRMAGTVRFDPVMSVDIAPSVLDLVGIPYPETWEGIPLFSEVADSNRLRLSEVDHEGNQLRALNRGDWVWIEANAGNPRGLPTSALFDLAIDPTEQINLVDKNPTMADKMKNDLLEVRARALSKKGVIPKLAIDRATEERLRALGYTK
jgi:arylsulfatase A-like enzyme